MQQKSTQQIIGLDASRAFLRYRTGIEEYAYQTIRHLRDVIPGDVAVRLYVRKKLRFQQGKPVFIYPDIDFALPEHWEVRGIWAPRFWTQGGLSLQMLFRPVDALFIPAHTVPLIHPAHSVVAVHGLEYEVCPRAYSWWARFYMRHAIRYSVRAASRVIAVSENTKRDLVRLYGVPEASIDVVHEGYAPQFKSQQSKVKNASQKGKGTSPYLLFIGRLEERKNVVRIIEAFEILKEKLRIPHSLVLVGKPGFGYEQIQSKIKRSKFGIDIQELGYVNDEEKRKLLSGADIFVFPSLYEGFGLPVLEAQAAGVPVVASEVASLPEVGGEGAVYADPGSPESIASGIQRLLQDDGYRSDIIGKGFLNIKRFSWEKCAQMIAEALHPVK